MPNLLLFTRLIFKQIYLPAGLLVVCLASASHSAPLPETVGQNLISFSPNVEVSSDRLSCVGIRVSKDVLLTSSECARIIDEELNNGGAIEVINSETVSSGQVIPISVSKTKQGFLGIDDWDYEQVEDRHYPLLTVLRGGAAIHGYAYHSGKQQEGIVNVNLQFLRVDEQQMTYRMENNLNFPSGTPVVNQEAILCIISSDGVCTAHISSPLDLLSRQRRSHNYSNSTYKPTTPYAIGESFSNTDGGIATIIIGSMVGVIIFVASGYALLHFCGKFCCPVSEHGSLLSTNPEVAKRYLEEGDRHLRFLQQFNRPRVTVW